MIIQNIFSKPNQFRLIYNGNTYIISEPIETTSSTFRLDRKMEATGDLFDFGVNWNYSDREIDLEFEEKSGRGVIEQAFDAEGINAKIVFQFGERTQGGFNIFFEGLLMLAQMERDKVSLRVPVQVVRFDDKFRTRQKVDIPLTRSVDLDGNAITPLQAYPVSMHSKVLQKAFDAEVNENDNPVRLSLDRNAAAQQNTVSSTVQFGFISVVEQQLAGSTSTPLAVGADFPPPQFIVEEEGQATVTVTLKFDANYSINGGNTDGIGATVTAGFRIDYVDGTRETETLYGNGTAGFASNINFDTGLQEHTRTITRTFTAGDTISAFIQCSGNHSNPSTLTMAGSIDVFGSCSLRVSQDTVTAATTAKGYLLNDVFSYLTRAMAGEDTAYSSDFYSGAAGNYMLMNGKLIRGFSETEANVRLSFNRLLKSMQALHCIGLNFESSEGGDDVIRIEKADYFFRDKEILQLESNADYKESVADGLVFSQLNFGYKKEVVGDVEETQGRDDPHTTKTYLTSISRHEKKLQVEADVIVSGYAIEATRRQQKAQDPTKDWKYDEDIFLVAVREDQLAPASVTVVWNYQQGNPTPNQLFITEDLSRYGQATHITISGAATKTVLNGQHQILGLAWVPILGNTIIYINTPLGSGADSSGTENNLTVTFQPSVYKAEADDFFTDVSGIISPESAYNLRLHPARMLQNWGQVVNSSLAYQPFSEQIRFVSGKANNSLSTTLAAGAPGGIGDTDRAPTADAGTFTRAGLQNGRVLYLPLKCQFTARMTYQQMQDLKKAFERRSDNDVWNGYILTTDYFGYSVKVHPLSVIYDMLLERVEVTGLVRQKAAGETPPGQFAVIVYPQRYTYNINIILSADGGAAIDVNLGTEVVPANHFQAGDLVSLSNDQYGNLSGLEVLSVSVSGAVTTVRLDYPFSGQGYYGTITTASK